LSLRLLTPEDEDGFREVHVNAMEEFWSLLRSWLRAPRKNSDKLDKHLFTPLVEKRDSNADVGLSKVSVFIVTSLRHFSRQTAALFRQLYHFSTMQEFVGKLCFEISLIAFSTRFLNP